MGGISLRTGCVIVAGLIAGILSGCTQTLDGSIDERFDSIDRSAGKSKNEAVLRNIARASENIPLTFITFQKVGGGLQATGTVASPSFILGPHAATNIVNRDVSISNTTLGGSAQATATLDFTVLETGDFYKALLDPSDLIDFNTLVQQGYPRELLFWLFADSVRIYIESVPPPPPPGTKNKAGQTLPQHATPPRQATRPQHTTRPRRVVGGLEVPSYYEIFNRVDWRDLPPKESDSCEEIKGIGWLCFRDMVELAMIAGLSVKVSPAEKTEQKLLPGRIATSRGTQIIYPTVVNVSSSSDSSKPKQISRLCVDPFYIRETALFRKQHRRDYKPSEGLKNLQNLLTAHRALSNPRHFCHGEPGKDDPSRAGESGSDKKSEVPRVAIISKLGNKQITFEIKTRSTFAIYQYLGKILHSNAVDRMEMTGLEKTTVRYEKILSIRRNQTTNCEVHVDVKNTSYCVPDDERESRNTKLIFSLLTQLVALKTNSKDVGITPSVRLTP